MSYCENCSRKEPCFTTDCGLRKEIVKKDKIIESLLDTLDFIEVETWDEVQEESATPLTIKDINRIAKQAIARTIKRLDK